ncbi:MAG TPA: helix-turn-helix domain-containing protein [Amycolatopsis sp.]|nr:helix-turn-helix domain-containing protein [Amycolatopsis sp.]
METVEHDEVRESILASWWRSRRFQVPADRIELPYFGEQNLDTPLIRGARPILDRLGDQLDGQPISLILTDPTGVVLTQRTGDADLHRHLEHVELVPGYSYGERFVGTNGIGTALEDGRPTSVFGHEHYAEHLENLACAGVPIRHPISGKTLGAVDLTCWRQDASGLLVALARITADQIQQALLTTSDLRELALFQSYLQACRRTTGIVMAFNTDITMMNDSARQLLDLTDQSILLGRAHQELADAPRATVTVTLSSGSKVRLHCRRVDAEGGDVAGGVLSVKLLENQEAAGTSAPILPMFLPGVVGSAPLWLRCCHDVDISFTRREWLVLAGEPGTGKHTLAQGVHRRRSPAGRLHTLDAGRMSATWREELRRDLIDDPVDTLVIRRVDRLGRAGIRTLTVVLGEVRRAADPPWLAVTVTPDIEIDAELLAFFPRTVTVPPLRRHVQDLSDLVPLFLDRLSGGGRLTCSPAAMHLLMRADWPGNVAQLYRVLKQVTKRRRTGIIQPADLPAEYRAITRRPLNRYETVERDAIVRSLEDADGNKARAAKLLGISRATIYRKIHEYGIVTPGH